ncbi:iron permease [Irpex lacteus]|nr:iron permease [Irpex lacteus]
MIMVANFMADFLSAFDMSVVPTALPTIVNDLGGSQFVWVGSAYALAGTAIVPLCGGLVSIWGRKPILLVLMALMAIGSAVAGSAKSMSILIIGRAFQGFGGCGALTVTEIIYADIIPLPQRGVMQGMASVVWAFATGLGPPLAGILANAGAWRWLFYLNLPLFGIAASLEIIFLHNTPPKATMLQQFQRMDWLGSAIVIGGTAAFLLALSWGGVQFPWSDPRTLVPLVVGIIALLGFMIYERSYAKDPIIPWSVFVNRSSVMGYIGTAIHGIVMYTLNYNIPVYLQAVKLTSTIRSGIFILGYSMLITPAALFCGVSVVVFKRYLPQNYIGWVLMTAGSGVLAVLDVDSSKAASICAPFMVGMGIGMGWTMTQFPILASLPYSNNAHAFAFFTFVRSLSQTIGVAIGGSILQNSLSHKLPQAYIAQLPSGVSFAYSAIPTLRSLDPNLRETVRHAFADSLKQLWLVLIGISGIGLVSVLFMTEIPMRNDLDEQWALEQKSRESGEKAARQ